MVSDQFTFSSKISHAGVNASSLGLFDSNNTDLFTGKYNFEIPIYSFAVGPLQIPISLTYTTGGFRVNQVASPVGLGWQLSCNGLISREVRGLPDETVTNGYLSLAGDILYNDLVDGLIDNTTPDEFVSLMDIASGSMDAEPDIFVFSAPGLNGKFIFDKDGFIHVIGTPKDKYKISYSQQVITGNESFNQFKEFIITDEKGTKYYFGNGQYDKLFNMYKFVYYDTENHYNTFTDNYLDKKYYGGKCVKSWENPDKFYYTTWYLNKIEVANNSEPILYSYDEEISTNYSSTSESKFVGEGYDLYGNVIPINTNDPFTIQRTNVYVHSTSQRLSNIKYKDLIINFVPEVLKREDVNDPILTFQGNCKAIDKILIENGPENSKSIELFQSYFMPSGTNQELTQYPTFVKRLKLDKVIIGEQKWEFEYFEGSDDLNLPSRNSPLVDYWGYYLNGTNRLSFPKIYLYPNDFNNPIYQSIYSIYPRSNSVPEFVLPGLDRTPNLINTKAYVLKKILLPTGGYKQLEYELNTFKLPNNEEHTGPGLRVKQIISSSGVNNVDLVENFTYLNRTKTATSGLVTDLPDFARKNIHALRNNCFSALPCFNTQAEIHDACTYRTNFSYNSIASVSGGYVGYTNVRVGVPEKGFTDYEFSFNPSFGNALVEPFTRPTTRLESVWDEIFPYFHKTNYFYEMNIVDRFPYLSAPIMDWSFGKLYKKTIRDINEEELEREFYWYRLVENIDDKKVYYVQANIYNEEMVKVLIPHFCQFIPNPNNCLPPSSSSPLQCCYPINLWENDILWGVNHYTFGYLVTDKIIKIVKTNNGGELVETNDFEYDINTGLLKKTQFISNSDRVLITNNYKYPNDYITNSEELLQCSLNYSTCMTTLENNYILEKKACDQFMVGTLDWYLCMGDADYQYEEGLIACENNYINCKSIEFDRDESILALDELKKKNMISEVVEKNTMRADKIIDGKVLEYKILNENQVLPSRSSSFYSNEPLLLPFLSSTKTDLSSLIINNCKLEEVYKVWNNSGELVNLAKNNGIDIIYSWGYNETKPIAETKNATTSESGYTGFENEEYNSFRESGNSGCSFDSDAFTGTKSMKVSNGYGPTNSFKVGLNANNHSGYKASVWVKGSTDAYLHIEVDGQWSTHARMLNNEATPGWHLLEVELPKAKLASFINGDMRVKVYIGTNGGTAYFDDLRFHPMDAQMTTFTYKPLVGMTSSSDANNKPTLYEYDGFGRLVLVKDFLGNILKKNEYHYKD